MSNTQKITVAEMVDQVGRYLFIKHNESVQAGESQTIIDNEKLEAILIGLALVTNYLQTNHPDIFFGE